MVHQSLKIPRPTLHTETHIYSILPLQCNVCDLFLTLLFIVCKMSMWVLLHALLDYKIFLDNDK